VQYYCILSYFLQHKSILIMAQIKVVLLDDDGQAIKTRFYELSDNLMQLNDMEREIEQLRPAILGDVTHDLLEEAQKKDEKKE
jgi:hypothetical protein